MKQNVNVQVVRLPDVFDLPLPSYMTKGAAAVDLHAAVEGPLRIKPQSVVVVRTGIAIAIPDGYEGQIRPRSGLAVKHRITVINSPATIDADYRGEIQVPLINLGDEPFEVSRGMRIAQLVLAPVAALRWEEVENLPPTPRGARGFGHTGS